MRESFIIFMCIFRGVAHLAAKVAPCTLSSFRALATLTTTMKILPKPVSPFF